MARSCAGVQAPAAFCPGAKRSDKLVGDRKAICVTRNRRCRYLLLTLNLANLENRDNPASFRHDVACVKMPPSATSNGVSAGHHISAPCCFFVVRKAFVGCVWCEDVSPRKAENDVVVFLVFDRK